VRKDGRQDGHVQAVRRRMQKMRPGMPKHDEVTGKSLSTATSIIFFYKHTIKQVFTNNSINELNHL
jgi:hypothetical protein